MRIRGVSRLASLLHLPSTAGAGDASSLRLRLDEARAAVRTWKAKATEAEARRREVLERVSSSAHLLSVYKQEVVAARRETPSIAVVRQVFSHRLRTLSARTSARGAAEREERLLRASAAYRTAIGLGEVPVGQGTSVDLDGLTWWIPTGTGEVRVPYRAILQTRDVASGGIMLDLGANVGRMAVPRVVLGDVVAAYCAEPDPMTYACLVRNVTGNGLRGLVLPDQTAISDRNGTARLLRVGASESFHLIGEPNGRADNVVEVPCCTLDTWVDRLGIDLEAVTFVKVDVEGSERRLLAGAGRVLACRHIAWQMEIKPAGLRAAGDEPEDLYADLRRAFTHFVDLNRRAVGRRVRPIGDLSAALQYIGSDGKTDVLLFSAVGLDPGPH